MSGVSYVHEQEIQGNKYKEFLNLSSRPLSKEDVATLVETFQDFIKERNSSCIKEVRMNSQGYFLFVIGDGSYGFDFYEYLNKKYKGTETINCANALYIFPRNLSKGVFPGYDSVSETNNIEEESTGYMDEEIIESITGKHTYSLHYLKTNVNIPITSSELIIGRSAREATFVIQGNTNVSRSHCSIYSQGGSIFIRDLDSLNGTYVNGLKISSNVDTALSIGDKVMVADEEFIVE